METENEATAIEAERFGDAREGTDRTKREGGAIVELEFMEVTRDKS